MTDRKTTRDRPGEKDRPKTERPPETARRPKGDEMRNATYEGRERATEQRGRDFDPNVNQRPR